jgi:hypothetical protein
MILEMQKRFLLLMKTKPPLKKIIQGVQTTDWFMRKPVTMLEFMFNTKLLLQSCNKIAEIVQNFK